MKINTNDPIILGRIIPNSGKIHQNQEVLSVNGGGITLKATHYKSPPIICVEESKDAEKVLVKEEDSNE